MIREEYVFEDIEDYLYNSNALLVAGAQNTEERSVFLFNLWKNKGKDIVTLKRVECGNVEVCFYSPQKPTINKNVNLCTGISSFFKCLKVDEKNILIDISSLDHVLIMFITKQFLTRVIPRSLFAAYIRPKRYCQQLGNGGFSLCEKVSGVSSVPGFTMRESENETLCAFIGFEGIRLKNILESVNNFKRFIPVIAFPLGAPQWYNVAMWNSMDTLESENKASTTMKCFSESIFEAFELLEKNIMPEEKTVLAPLGTRAHSMASAIFACHHKHTRIIYDYVIESKNRTNGVENITIYHLSSFLKI